MNGAPRMEQNCKISSTAMNGSISGKVVSYSDVRSLPGLHRLTRLVMSVQSTAHDSRLATTQKSAYIALTILPPYVLAKLRDRMLSSSWSDEPLPRNWFALIDPRRAFPSRTGRSDDEGASRLSGEWKRVIWEGLRVGEKAIALADLVNFLVFLYDGRSVVSPWIRGQYSCDR